MCFSLWQWTHPNSNLWWGPPSKREEQANSRFGAPIWEYREVHKIWHYRAHKDGQIRVQYEIMAAFFGDWLSWTLEREGFNYSPNSLFKIFLFYVFLSLSVNATKNKIKWDSLPDRRAEKRIEVWDLKNNTSQSYLSQPSVTCIIYTII
jgi:hypothetical protein